MILRPMTFEITEDPNNGWITIHATIKHTNGQTSVGKTIREYSVEYGIGRKAKAITRAIKYIIYDFQKESVFED